MSESRRSASLVCALVREECGRPVSILPTAFCLLPTVFCCALAIAGVEIRSKQMVRRDFILSFGLLMWLARFADYTLVRGSRPRGSISKVRPTNRAKNIAPENVGANPFEALRRAIVVDADLTREPLAPLSPSSRSRAMHKSYRVPAASGPSYSKSDSTHQCRVL